MTTPSSSKTGCATRRATSLCCGPSCAQVPVVLGSATPVAGKLCQCARRSLRPAGAAQPSGRSAARDPLRRHAPRASAAWVVAGAGRRAACPGGARRAEPGVRQPARFCAGPGVHRVRMDQPLHALLGKARAASQGPAAALPLLRARGARHVGVPRVRQPGPDGRGARHAAPGAALTAAVAGRARSAHRPR